MIKRSFLDLTLRFQRERAEARSTEAVERVAYRRHEIEQAWAVLRNPAARARYDDELVAAKVAREQAASGVTRSVLPPVDDLPVLEVLDADDGRMGRPSGAPPSRSRRRRIFGSSFRSPPAAGL